MFWYIVYTILLTILLLIFKNKNKITNLLKIYSQIRNTVDPERKLGHFFIFSSLFKMAFHIAKTKLTPPQTFEKFNRNHIKIPYNYNDKQYFYLLKVPKGVQPLKSITDENNKDIEKYILPYLGPNLDCHGINLCPKDFGYKQIKITTIFDNEIILEENSNISL